MTDDRIPSIRPMMPDDWPRVEEIYAQGIATGDTTLETETPDWSEWDASHLDDSRLVAEVSVYVAENARGGGLGTRLLEELIARSEEQEYWTLEAGVFPENRASLRAFEKAGFRRVGLREGLGRQGDGDWRDVVLMERRSDTVGVAEA